MASAKWRGRAARLAILMSMCVGVAAQHPNELSAARPQWGSYGVCTVDVDGDSLDEVYTVNHYAEELDKGFQNYVWFNQSPVPGGMKGRAASADLDGDGVPEIVLSGGVRESALVFVVSAKSGDRRKILVSTGRSSRRQPFGWAVWQLAFADLNGDGIKDIVIGLVSGYEWRDFPRAVFAVDGRTGSVLWRYGMGPNPGSLLVADCNQDGRPEVVISTQSPGNGCSENGTDDANSYVICLDAAGRELWRNELRSGTGGTVTLAKATAMINGRQVLVAADQCAYAGTPPDAVVVLDAKTGMELRRVEAEGIQGGPLLADINGDGIPEVITAVSGKVIIRDLKLNLLRQRQLPTDNAVVALCDHLLGRRTMELAVSAAGSTIVILNSKLQTIWQYDVPGQSLGQDGFIPVRRGRGEPRALIYGTSKPWVLEGNPDVLEEVYGMVQPQLDQQFPWALATGALAVALVLVASIFWYAQTSYRGRTSAIIGGLSADAGVLEIDRRGRVRHANQKGRALLRAAGASEDEPFSGTLGPLGDAATGSPQQRELPLFLPSGETVLARVAPLRDGWLLTLEDMSAADYLRRAKSWAPAAQALAHDIKNKLTAVGLAMQRLSKHVDADGQSLLKETRDEADRCRRMAHGFMLLTKVQAPRLAPGDLNELVRDCLSRFALAMPAHVTVAEHLSDGVLGVHIDRSEMMLALSNVIQNAVDAMAEPGVLTVSTSMRLADACAAVEVADTGAGIPEYYLGKVVEPGFSLKDSGTGYGMSITKRIVEDHGGSITISSIEGQGTTVRIVLPLHTGDRST